MNSKPLVKKLPWLSLSLLALISSGCITIREKEFCAVAGVMPAGAICTKFLGAARRFMTFDEYIEFLEARDERPDPANPGQTLPAKAAAISMSAEDFKEFKTEHEVMCRMLGKKCKYQFTDTVENLGIVVESDD